MRNLLISTVALLGLTVMEVQGGRCNHAVGE